MDDGRRTTDDRRPEGGCATVVGRPSSVVKTSKERS